MQSSLCNGEEGPWSNRPGFDEIGAAVSGLFTIEGSRLSAEAAANCPHADNVVGWFRYNWDSRCVGAGVRSKAAVYRSSFR